MQAMVAEKTGQALQLVELPVPVPYTGQVLIAVEACGVCRTDLHLLDGELLSATLPVIPGHEIVGRVVELGPNTTGFRVGQRVGVPWLGWTCGSCRFCLAGRENLCDEALFTGCQINGGYAQYTVADVRYCFALSELESAENLAPLLCAGLIGFRSLRMAGEPHSLGIYGFGAAAHIVTQIALKQGREVYALTRPGDIKNQAFARSLGASWAGDTGCRPPVSLDGSLIFAPDGKLVPLALEHSSKGACIVCAGIHMSDIPSFSYAHLWGERSIRSVAHLTRKDGMEFFEYLKKNLIETHVRTFSLARANDALNTLRDGEFQGAIVLKLNSIFDS